ncbi:MAG: DUF2142 domain-containing protein [Lachnospiraceae bacterium]|nr:DUF2142 domain-containing protein [Lachnospiraceae bacterium]
MKKFIARMQERTRHKWWMLLLVTVIWLLFLNLSQPFTDTHRGITFGGRAMTDGITVISQSTVTQDLMLTKDQVNELRVYARVGNPEAKVDLELTLLDENGNVIGTSVNHVADIAQKGYLNVEFPRISHSKWRTMTVQVKGLTHADQAKIELLMTHYQASLHKAALNGTPQAAALLTRQGFLSEAYFRAKVLLILLMILYSYIVIIFMDGKAEHIFLWIALGMSVLIMTNPFPHRAGEEKSEFRAMAAGSGTIFYKTYKGKTGVQMPVSYDETVGADWDVISLKSVIDDPEAWSRPFSERNQFLSDETMAAVQPLPFFPAALGNKIGRGLRMPIFLVIWLARLCGYLYYVLMAYFVLKVMHHYRTFFLALYLSPVMLSYCTTVTEETAACVSAISLVGICLHYRTDEEAAFVRRRHIVLIFLCVLGLVSTRYLLYAPLLLFLLMIPREKWRSKKERRWVAVIICAVALLFFMIERWLVHTWPVGDPSVGNIDAVRQLTYMGEHASEVFGTLTKYLADDLENILLVREYTALTRSGENVNFLTILRTLCALMLPVAAVLEPDKFTGWGRREKRRMRILLPVLFVFMCYGLVAAMYLTATPVGARKVLGVEPVFFYPLLELFYFWMSLCFPRTRDSVRFTNKVAFWMLAGAINIFCTTLLIFVV